MITASTVLVALGALATALSAFGCARAQRPSAVARVVFASTRDGNTDVYISGIDGSGLRRLTHDAAPDRFPRCSADGRHVTFVRGDGPTRAVYRLDLDDGSEHRLTARGAVDYTPVWSVDGSRIFFTRAGSNGGFDRIGEMRRDGSGVRLLTDGAAHDVHPAPSPDGRRLVFHSYRYGQGNTELVLLELPSGAITRLTNHPGRDYEGVFVGDDRIVFSSNRDGGHFRLYVLSVADSSVRPLVDASSDAWGARYSRTGDMLFYTGSRGTEQMHRSANQTGVFTRVMADGYPNFAGDWCGSTSPT